ncbi:MAG: response regulator transcription factor [Anaerolineae bacterium]
MSQIRRVLVADDQQPTQHGLHALLDLLPGVEWVGEASNGREAVSLTLEKRADVVLMDVRMPEMDGLEAMRLIKGQRPEVKVIVLTIHGDYRQEALAAGADVFLVKGGHPGHLRETICTV